ncbi:MAG: porin family protein, partial [Xanthobacteraceae bacterium]
MKRILITTVLSIAAAAPALAADLPQPMAPQAPAAYVPVVAPVYNWGGIYVGINGGWGWGTSKWTTGTNAAVAIPGSWDTSDNGGVVGATVGANFQTGEFVFGVEGDWDYSAINTGTSSTICNVAGACQSGNNWLATLRGRFGYAADHVLFYGTAGGAFANVQG